MKRKESTISTFILGLCGLMLIACDTQPPLDKYCGQELTNTQVIGIKTQGENSYEYSDADLDLLADLTTEVQELFNDTLVIEVFFFLKDRDRIGLYLIGPDDKAVLKKISCYLLDKETTDRLPMDRYLLFYSNENEDLVAGIRKKKQELMQTQ